MTDTVLVTGGSGYIGGWCIATLLERGYDVRTTVRDLSRADHVRSAVATVVDPADRLAFAAADLTTDDGWDEAVAGCRYVVHVASPLGGANAKDPSQLTVPARDGTLRVLRAAVASGAARVVMTSACNTAQPSDLRQDVVTDESLWTDTDQPGLAPYRLSKTLAERAAWDFMATQTGTELTTVLPGAVFGPVLSADTVGSAQIIARLLQGRMPRLPGVAFQVVDVRDLADLHVRAMTSPDAVGERFIGAGEVMTFRDIAATLRDQLGPAADKVPTRSIPDLVVRVMGRFQPEARAVVPSLGRRQRHSAAKAHRVLGWTPRPGMTTVVDCARSLSERGARSRLRSTGAK